MQLKDVFEERWLNVSNCISAGRMLLLPPFLWASIRYAQEPARDDLFIALVAIVFLAVITDFLDGFLARLLKQETKLGRYLDPVSDKVVSLGSLIILTLYYNFPWPVLGLYILREIFGVWLGWFLYFKRDMQGKPNAWGKIGVFVTAATVFWYVLLPRLSQHYPADHWLLQAHWSAWAMAAVLLIGVAAYARTYAAIVLRGRTAG